MLIAAPAAAEWRRNNREECARTDRQLQAIESQRRAGYTAKQGRRLNARREQLERARRERCR
ncbi:MAG: hypothetical protein QY320_11995 [Gammaproteobacteria bacterium]|nr:MAG: hypothetical protein QY320_11995 [Gammaproteobacteria bacterium]